MMSELNEWLSWDIMKGGCGGWVVFETQPKLAKFSFGSQEAIEGSGFEPKSEIGQPLVI